MKKVLVAYFSHKGENYFSGKIVDIQIGNTCIAAQKAVDMLGCDIFEIQEEEAYPVDYRQCVARAVKEKKEDARPKIKDVCDIAPYDSWFSDIPTGAEQCLCPYGRFYKAVIFRARSFCRSAQTRAAARDRVWRISESFAPLPK